MNQKIILTVGISGSGKSIWATNFIASNPNYIRVNRDAIRQQITGTNRLLLSQDLENLVTKIESDQIRTILKEGYNVIVDATHLKTKYIQRFVKEFNYLCDINLQVFSIELEEAKWRVSVRESKLKDFKLDYIDKQYESFKNLDLKILSYPKKEILLYKQNPELSDCIICDLDGTLSLYDHKTKSPYDRDFENDSVNIPIQTFIEEVSMWYDRSGEDHQAIKIFFFSGRNNKFRKQTMQFLNSCFFGEVEFELIMRDETDMRRDSVIKLEMFEDYVRDQYNVLCVFDDRLQVIEECWNPLGVFVFNCNQTLKRY